MDAVVLLQTGAAAVLNGAFAWLAGVLCARHWLEHAAPSFFPAIHPALRRSAICAGLAGVLAALAGLWAATAGMAGSGLAEALPLLPDVMAGTAYGRAGMVATAALAALALLHAFSAQARMLPAAALLLLFVAARASVSHAGEHGFLSVDVAIDMLHLALVGVWLGGVALAACLVLPAARVRSLALPSYLHALSMAATVALTGIVASGAFNSWRRVGSLEQLGADGYGLALCIKLALFAVAALLGAYNRFAGFPMAAQDGGARALLVLRIEALVLALVLAAAAWLTVLQPPG